MAGLFGLKRLLGFERRERFRESRLALTTIDLVEDRAHRRRQAIGVEGLGHVPGGAQLLRAESICGLPPAGDEDDRDLAGSRLRQQLGRDRPAGQAWHHHVEQDEIGAVARNQRERLVAVGSLEHAEPGFAECGAAEGSQRRVVVDDEDGARG